MSAGTVSLDQARALLDYRGRPDAKWLPESLVESQLEGAVAAHNLLRTKNVCYVADEVGTGKTLVAAGALALLRHADPGMRALVIAPKRNLQTKWQQELESFARSNIAFPDLRVRGADDEPVRRPAYADNLADAVSLWQEDPTVDVVARLSSFQLGHSDNASAEYVERWRPHVASGRSAKIAAVLRTAARTTSTRRKEILAACMNRLMPDIGLLVLDEAHNLKGGIGPNSAARNRVLWTFLGHNPEYTNAIPGYGPKVERVLMLSATPLEDDTSQLRNQLDALGIAHLVPGLEDADDEVRHEELRTFLFRRLTKLRVAGVDLTRNRYRQEWRAGGTMTPTEPLRLDGDRERLTLALVQKKVADAVNAGANKHFQIGMLTSFESLSQSADSATRSRPKPDPDPEEIVESSDYDDTAQNRQATEEERRGIDTAGIMALVRSHEQEFQRPPRHAKLDAVVDRLVANAKVGRKSLVFTRRIASVGELVQRVNDELDQHLRDRLRDELPVPDREVDELYRRYQASRRQAETQPDMGHEVDSTDPVDITSTLKAGDSFFSWLVRDESATDLLRIRSMRRRFERSGIYATLLRDNYVAALLGCHPEETPAQLAKVLGAHDAPALVNDRAQQYLSDAVPAQRFDAAQWSALTILEQFGPKDLSEPASAALAVLTPPELRSRRGSAVSVYDDLAVSTLATAVRADPHLSGDLWHGDPATAWADETEMRLWDWNWRLLSAAVRLDYPALDLWACEVSQAQSLRATNHPFQRDQLTADFLKLMRKQRDSAGLAWSGYQALKSLAANTPLILAANGVKPKDTDTPAWVGSRVPAVGLSQRVNRTALAQFRTPTYPLVLVSTDLVQEGEDLHTFCDEVHHYGIAWMPSSLEQRTGRVDRVNSLTERRLSRTDAELDADGRPPNDERIQVLYPYLASTYEQVQADRVFRRLDEHIRLLHNSFGHQVKHSPHINVNDLSDDKPTSPEHANLGEPYAVRREWLKGRVRKFPLVTAGEAAQIQARFASLVDSITELDGHRLTWQTRNPQTHILGEVSLAERVQPLHLRLTSAHGLPMVRVVSPVGLLTPAQIEEISTDCLTEDGTRIGVVRTARDSFSMSVEDVVPFGSELAHLSLLTGRLAAVARRADELERQVLELDHPLEHFRADLEQEVRAGG